MLETVLRKTGDKLGKPPVLVLDIPRSTKKGAPTEAKTERAKQHLRRGDMQGRGASAGYSTCLLPVLNCTYQHCAELTGPGVKTNGRTHPDTVRLPWCAYCVCCVCCLAVRALCPALEKVRREQGKSEPSKIMQAMQNRANMCTP